MMDTVKILKSFTISEGCSKQLRFSEKDAVRCCRGDLGEVDFSEVVGVEGKRQWVEK